MLPPWSGRERQLSRSGQGECDYSRTQEISQLKHVHQPQQHQQDLGHAPLGYSHLGPRDHFRAFEGVSVVDKTEHVLFLVSRVQKKYETSHRDIFYNSIFYGSSLFYSAANKLPILIFLMSWIHSVPFVSFKGRRRIFYFSFYSQEPCLLWLHHLVSEHVLNNHLGSDPKYLLPWSENYLRILISFDFFPLPVYLILRGLSV